MVELQQVSEAYSEPNQTRDKVFKGGPSKIRERQPLKIWSDMVC